MLAGCPTLTSGESGRRQSDLAQGHASTCTEREISHVQVANGGGLEALALDAAGRVLSRSYAQRVATHEAGHFLLAYLVGLLPKSYTLSSVDALRR